MNDPSSMDSFAGKAGAYVHIPFCGALCPYCDFAVVVGRDDLAARYCNAVVTEIGQDTRFRELDAVYFGGGTPSRMPVEMMSLIVEALESRHGLSSEAEVSLEANPEDFDASVAEGLVGAGFNRISFGAQSFDDNVLLQLGRRHDAGQVGSAVALARGAGFDNVSLDLIYGTPGETDSSWRNTLARAVDAGPDHVSCYALTVEKGTQLGREVDAGAPTPDPDVQADRFETADMALRDAGLARYEVSNWSKPGYECVYNSTVWAQGEYVAYGNSAHRFRDGVRSRNFRHLPKYLEAVETSGSAVAGAEPPIAGIEAEIDRLFVGLRRTVGAEAGVGGRALLDSDDGQRLVELGVITSERGRILVNNPMLTDEVLRSVLALETVDHAKNRRFPDNVLGEGG